MLETILPWRAFVNSAVVETNTGAVFSVWRIEPASADLLEEFEIAAWRDRLAALMGQFSGRWTWTGESQPGAHYLCASYQPDRTGLLGRSEMSQYLENVGAIDDLMRSLFASAEMLRGSDLLGALRSQVIGSSAPIRAPSSDKPLGHILAVGDLHAGTAPRIDNKYLITITLRDPHALQTDPTLVESMQALPFAFRWSTRWVSMTTQEAKAVLNARVDGFERASIRLIPTVLSRWIPALDDHTRDPDELHHAETVRTARQSMLDGRKQWGWLTSSVILFRDTLAEARHDAGIVQQVFEEHGYSASISQWSAIEHWLAAMFGESSAGIFRLPLSNTHAADCMPLRGVSMGPEHGFLPCTTSAGTPYRFGFADREFTRQPNHFLVIGQTGGGKSYLCGAMLSSFLADDPANRVIVLDRGRSSRGWVQEMGGRFIESQAMQPLVDAGGDAYEWLCAALRENDALDMDSKLAVRALISQLMHVQAHERTILRALEMADGRVRQCLALFEGGLFDGREHGLSGRCVSYEIGAWGSNTRLGILAFTQFVKRQLDGIRPTVLLLDEAAVALLEFADYIDAFLKTMRKYNCSVGLAMQSASDALNAPDSVLSQTTTRIFMPDAQAKQPALEQAYERLGMGQRARAALTKMTPRQDYMLWQDDRRVVFRLDIDRELSDALSRGGVIYDAA